MAPGKKAQVILGLRQDHQASPAFKKRKARPGDQMFIKKQVTEELLLERDGDYSSSGQSDVSFQPLLPYHKTDSPSGGKETSSAPEGIQPVIPQQRSNANTIHFDSLAANAPSTRSADPVIVTAGDMYSTDATGAAWRQPEKQVQLEEAQADIGADDHQHAASHLPPAVLTPSVASPAPAAAPAPAATNKLPPIQPLPPPSPSEGSEVQDEYKHYLQRFKAGDTLAQRWQRLRENGKWDEVKEEWEEWQSDILLQELQASNAASRSTRGRGRGRKDADELMETDDLGPRRSRTRRAPATLQDYQVDTPVSTSPAPGVAHECGVAAENRSTASAGYPYAFSAEEQEVQLAKCSRRQPPPRVVQYRTHNPSQQQHSYVHQAHSIEQPQHGGSHWQQHQQQSSWQQQQQHDLHSAAGAEPLCSPELMQRLYAMGAQLGAALQQGDGGPPAARHTGAGACSNSAAVAAAMEALCMRVFGGDTAAMMQHLAAALQQHH